jgi:hypothetical protein
VVRQVVRKKDNLAKKSKDVVLWSIGNNTTFIYIMSIIKGSLVYCAYGFLYITPKNITKLLRTLFFGVAEKGKV